MWEWWNESCDGREHQQYPGNDENNNDCRPFSLTTIQWLMINKESQWGPQTNVIDDRETVVDDRSVNDDSQPDDSQCGLGDNGYLDDMINVVCPPLTFGKVLYNCRVETLLKLIKTFVHTYPGSERPLHVGSWPGGSDSIFACWPKRQRTPCIFSFLVIYFAMYL